MPTYKSVVVFESRDFNDENEMTKELFDRHGDELFKDDRKGYWCGQGTFPGTFAYKIEERRVIFGPERPPNNQSDNFSNEDTGVDKDNKTQMIANWHDYYRYIFGEEEPLFLGTEGKFSEMYLEVIELMYGKNYPLKEFVELIHMNCCLFYLTKK